MKPDRRRFGQKEKHEGHLHGLKLISRDVLRSIADGQVGCCEQCRERDKQPQTAYNRHPEKESRRQQNDRHLNETDSHERHYLPQHDLYRFDRHRQEIFHRAALDFAGDRECGEEHHCHGQNDPSNRVRYELGLALGIVSPVNAKLGKLTGPASSWVLAIHA